LNQVGPTTFRIRRLCTIEIEALTSDSEDNPFAFDDFGRVVSSRQHEWNGFMRIPGAAGDERARIFISFAPDERSVLDEIVAKAEKEARQLSGTEGPSVVMLDRHIVRRRHRAA
jgi:hypothetical protein